MHGIERATRLAGHHVALASSASSVELEAEQLRKAGRMAQGVLLWPIAGSPNGPLLAELMAAGCPVVLLDRVMPAPPIDAVVADNVAAGFLLTRYLLEQGHERIAFVRGGELEASSVIDRVAGYQQAFRESGTAPHPGWISATPYGPADPDEQRYNCVARLLAQRPPPTAFIAANAAILVTLIRDLVHFGVHIPDDVVVAATDSTAGDSLLRLATASIVFDCAAMGDEAVRLLLKRRRLGAALPAQRVVVPVALHEEQAINVHITPGAAASG
jgi:LacI family transcriptional regulator